MSVTLMNDATTSLSVVDESRTFPIGWPVPVGHIEFADIGALVPAADMTVQECCQIMILLTIGINSRSVLDYVGYVKQHGLERHFKQK